MITLLVIYIDDRNVCSIVKTGFGKQSVFVACTSETSLQHGSLLGTSPVGIYGCAHFLLPVWGGQHDDNESYQIEHIYCLFHSRRPLTPVVATHYLPLLHPKRIYRRK